MASFPYTKFDKIKSIKLKEDKVQDFSIEEDGVKLDCRLNQKIKNDYLIVTPNGAVDREKYELPVFARWNYQNIFNAPILSISDPTLQLEKSLRIGWFSGSRDSEVAQFTADAVAQVANELGISHDRIIFWGSSSGGYSSILLASKIDGACFVSVNGQSTINNYYAGHVEDYRKVFDDSLDVEQIILKYPERWSIISALNNSYNKDLRTKGVVVQNTVDEMHYIKHYTPFCDYFSLPLAGGKSDKYDLWSFIFKHDKGHGPEPSNIAKQIVKEYFPLLLSN